MTSDAPEPVDVASLIRPFGRFVAWIGASVGALTAVLAALGYLVEGGFLASLGLRRGMLELASTEYIATGGQFVLGLVPISVVGALSFVLEFWWAALLVAAAFGLGTWCKLGAAYRWWLCATGNAVWLASAIPMLDAATQGSDANRVMSMMTFVAMLSVLYALLEHAAATPNPGPKTLVSQIAFYAVLSVALLTLPYARGSKGLERDLPSVQLPGKVATLLCEFAAPADLAACAARSWRLVQLGKDRSVLLDPHDGAIYILPAAMTASLRIVNKASDIP